MRGLGDEGDWLTYTEAAERPNRREARGELAA